jgi:phosphoribosylanthranilate isomerase
MIFVPTSPRRCKQTEAAVIAGALRRRVELAGVFQNAALDHVVHTAEGLHLSMVQLHGDEGPAYAKEVARRTGAKVIKAVRAKWRVDVIGLRAFRTDFHLLDGAGGQTFEWSLARALGGRTSRSSSPAG